VSTVAAPDLTERRNVPLIVLLILPIALVNSFGFLAPVLNLLRMSFYEVQATGAMREVYTLATWINVLHDSFYAELIINSIMVSLGITLLTLLCSYPIALYLHRSSGTWRSFLLVLVISPLLTSAVVRTYGWIAILSENGLVNNAITKLGFSARGYDRILKVARTIADLDGAEDLEPKHLSEAVQYRTLDRNLWL